MPNGIAIVDQWWLHVPAVWVDTQHLDTRRIERSGVLLREAGGEVARAEWPDGSRWHASLGELRGRTVDDTGAPLAGINVGLAETDYRSTSDSSGFFEILDVAPGSYRITAVEPDLSRLGISLVTAQEFAARRDSVLDVIVRVPSSDSFVDRACHSDVASSGEQGGLTSGRLIGRVVQRDGKPAPGVQVDVELVEEVSGPRPVAAGGATDADGMFHLCRWIPVGRTVIVRARDGTRTPVLMRLQVSPGVTTVRLELP
ncbi:MAG TPA: carboxypeptidase regulatory-like domain-containing protein [Gemmatimonadaceae bacterium]|nr:carboxypeptidase regulatory-like domain-containing protein [Gemmatimonadaceae bacterium]